jgi:pyruvate dehydrogenase E2 component (dihydrolipoamide acetyltransferase)
MARELGVDLSQVTATGPRGRILKEDVQAYVKKALTQGGGAAGAGIPPVPDIDFAAFGEIEAQPLSRIQKLTAAAMQRSWLNVPHVAHFDEADITDLEEFRAQNKEKAKARELKLTFLPFLLKACAVALREHPQFNVSLSADGDTLIHKKYCHIGIAMDTPAGLMVPVIRDVDKKGIWELAEEMTALGEKGKTGKLSKADLTGGCFTISSLGAIGGTAFTPIVNLPEVAILGVSKTQVKPVFIEDAFVPRKMLPITLSYDHRAVNGVDAGQFMTCLTRLLADIRRLVM